MLVPDLYTNCSEIDDQCKWKSAILKGAARASMWCGTIPQKIRQNKVHEMKYFVTFLRIAEYKLTRAHSNLVSFHWSEYRPITFTRMFELRHNILSNVRTNVRKYVATWLEHSREIWDDRNVDAKMTQVASLRHPHQTPV